MGYRASVNVRFNNELGATLTISVIDRMMRATMKECGAWGGGGGGGGGGSFIRKNKRIKSLESKHIILKQLKIHCIF